MTRTSTCLAAVLLGALPLAADVLQTSSAQPPDESTMVLTGARLIDGTGSAPLEQAALVIVDGRIEAVGAASAMSLPAEAVHVDLTGKTVLPGLINAHGHLNAGRPDLPSRERLSGQLRLYADYGVTAVVVLGVGTDDMEEALELRDEQNESATLHRARVYVAGPSLQGLATAEEARARVDAYADAGVDIVKIRLTGAADDMPPAVYSALIERAHARGLKVAAHLYYLDDARGLADAGIDVIAHSVRDQDVDEALVSMIREKNIAYVPTLTRDLAQFVYETTPDFFTDPFFLRRVSAYRGEMTALSSPAHQQQIRDSAERQATKSDLAQGMRNLRILSDAGVLIAMGSDSGTNQGQWQGYFEHTELEMMVEAGLSPAEAIVAATGSAARAAGLDEDLGTLQPGRWADLLVLNSDPLNDIRAIRQIESVWIAGRRVPGVP